MGHQLIFTCLSGSHLYGTNRPDSDVDIRGVCFPLKENILGMQKFEQWQPSKNESLEWSSQFGIESDDICIYSLEKFMKLCSIVHMNLLQETNMQLLFGHLMVILQISLDGYIIEIINMQEEIISTPIMVVQHGLRVTAVHRTY